MRFVKLYGYFFRINLKRLVEYRADFCLNLVAMIVWASSGLIEILILFGRLQTLSGWTLEETALLYGLWSLTFAVYNAFGHGIMDIEQNVLTGKMDTLLTKPLNPLFLLLTSHLNTMGMGMLLLGTTVTVIAACNLSIAWNIGKLLYLLLSVVTGGVIIFSIYFILSAMAFWHGRVHGAIRVGYDVHMFAKYPLSIYGRVIQLLLIFVFPYAFTNYVPAAVLLGKMPMVYGVLPVFVCLLLLGLALLVWSCGIRRYEGSGS